jgi:peptidyl-prolyl cis-trans isomerase B (cyclophilin B)
MAFIMLIPALTGCVTIGERKPIATITFSNGVEIRARLYPDKAPNTVANFISLANSGFYDGSPVHRIVEYSIVQMGRSADGENDAGYYIKGEFPDNGFSKNDMLHEKGVLSMARTVGAEGNEKEYYNTASSQFFICVDVETTLDGAYAPFGKVISGYDDFEEISRLDVDENYAPRDELYIKSVTVDTYGKDYGEPKKIDKE